jgi:hypothetical protein
MKKSATLPCIITVDDYHEFEYVQRAMQIINHKIKVEELDNDILDVIFGDTGRHGLYYGIAYEGRLPSKKRMIELLRDTPYYAV